MWLGVSFTIFQVEDKGRTSEYKKLKGIRNKEYGIILNSLKSPDGN